MSASARMPRQQRQAKAIAAAHRRAFGTAAVCAQRRTS